MVLETVLLIFLIATVLMGIRLHLDIKKLKVYKGDFDKILKKTEASLTDLENTTERFRYVCNSEKDILQRLIQKAHSVKDELLFVVEKTQVKSVDTPKRRDRNLESVKVTSRKNNIVKDAQKLR